MGEIEPRNQTLAHPFLAEIDMLCEQFRDRAEATDTGGPANDLLRANIRRLAEIGYYGASVAPQYGGLGLPEPVKREATERLAAACGVTAFTQHQIHGGAGFVSGFNNEVLKSEILPRLCSGETLCGVAFAHLRRAGAPQVTARREGDGLVIDGSAPWITGWDMLDSFILGARIAETGEDLFIYCDRAEHGYALSPSEPMALAVMAASDTRSIRIDALKVDARWIVGVREPDGMKRSDYCAITSHVTLPLGCARGSVAYLRSLGKEIATSAAGRLEGEIDQCREQALLWGGARADDPDYRDHALRARATSVNLALRAAETAIAASGGRAHLLSHPAQRRLREAGFYATLALTADTQSALMETFSHAC